MASAVRVLIDLRWMRPGLAGGIENLSRALVGQLSRLDRFNSYTVLVPSEARYDFDTRVGTNFTFVTADGPGACLRVAAQRLYRRMQREQETSPRPRIADAEIALSVNGYIHPDVAYLDNVLIVPDVQHEYRPEFFEPRELSERRRLYTVSMKRAAHVCAISEFTRQTLIDRLDIPTDRVTTTYLAADPMFQPGSRSRTTCPRVLQQYGLKFGEYLLFPANTWPHKNHRAAIDALRLLREAYGRAPLLVCTGNPKGAHAELLTHIRDSRLDGHVRFLGYCPAEHMPALYEGAAALLFPSLFEGFGIPLVEAMWCDCPIICSNTTSLPEIAGDAALLVNPESSEALAHAIHRVLTDDALRSSLIERGRRRATQFSWVKFTAEIVRILHEVRRLRQARK